MAHRLASAFVLMFFGSLFTADSSFAEEKANPSSTVNLASLPTNTWTRISQRKFPNKAFTHVTYLPATDEFLSWGKAKAHRYDAVRYDVETLNLSQERPEWTDSFPTGKESSWANGMFPDWSCPCHRSLSKKRTRPWLNDVFDRYVGPFAAVNAVTLVETDGVLRPTRAAVFNQVCYDSKRERLFYFVGGKTFAYDPKTKRWSDLKAEPPLTCETLVWASLCYDPVKDQVILFGGGQALNPWGGAKTWTFDCAKNLWTRPKLLDGKEPPLRCNAKLIYDSKHKKMVLFGGFAQDRLLSDTWLFDPATLQWEEKKTNKAPPPETRYAAAYLPKHGLILYVFPNYSGRSGVVGGGVWTYDVAQNEWLPRLGDLPKNSMTWLACDYSPKDDAVVLSVWSPNGTAQNNGSFLYRLDPRVVDKNSKRKTAPDALFRWYIPKQQESLLNAPAPDPQKTEALLKALPANKPINSDFPGALARRDYSGATMDTDRSTVIYHGGGHSTYGGNDFAQYSIENNRWKSAQAYFCPFLDGASVTVYGWSYGMRPFIQHTYRWYAYDPLSKMVLYCPRRMGNMHGKKVLLDEDPKNVFTYDIKKHGALTWVYNPTTDSLFRPVLGRSFDDRGGQLNLIGTPEGIFAKSGKHLYQAKVKVDPNSAANKAEVTWTLLDSDGPKVAIKHGYIEFQPLVYDSKRNRLLYIAMSKDKGVEVYQHPLGKGSWTNLNCKGGTNLHRDVIYDQENDCLITMPKQSLHVMDCKTNVWKELDVAMPQGLYGVCCCLLYAPKHKLCVMMIPKPWMRVFLFRFDPASAQYKAPPPAQK